MTIALIFILFILGAGLGSFACCQVWRIRKNDKSKWSHCMKCGYRLRWYDNIPILSWLMLGGKCRKCRKKIGSMEILTELGLALLFALSFWLWPEQKEVLAGELVPVIHMILYYLLITVLCIVFLYDSKWKEIPVIALIISSIIGVLYFAVTICDLVWGGYALIWQSSGSILSIFVDILLGLVLLPGFYFLMYKLSHEKWVGGGDYLLCIPLALVLSSAWLSLSCLFASNLIGCVVMLPVLAMSKKKEKMIPMGPFLILGFLVVFFCQNFILEFISF